MPFSGKDAERLARRTLEDLGWQIHQAEAQLVRRYGGFRTKSNDLWGCIDLACIHVWEGVWFVQVTTKAQMSHRRRKVGTAVRWPLHKARVSVFEALTEPAPKGSGKRIRKYFRIHDLTGAGWVAVGQLDVISDEKLKLVVAKERAAKEAKFKAKFPETAPLGKEDEQCAATSTPIPSSPMDQSNVTGVGASSKTVPSARKRTRSPLVS